jgi:DNA-binding NtrC family response regulator
VLQSGEFQRLGSSVTRRADVRIVSATNADLRQSITAGRFREDLYYRLNVIEIVVPPLDCRPEDVLPLARTFLAAAAPPDEPLSLSPDAERALLIHTWDGNVRELENRIRRAALVRTGPHIRAADLDLGERAAVGETRAASSDAPLLERRRIERALVEAEGVVSRAAEELGLSRQALYRKMDRLGIVLERRPRDGPA